MMLKKSGSSPNKKPKWFAYDLLAFLLDVDVPKKTISTAHSDEEDLEVIFSPCLLPFMIGPTLFFLFL